MGRGRLRDDVRAALEAGGTVVLTGPAGIGKTAIATDAARTRACAVGQCLPALVDHDYRPLVHALRTPLSGSPDAVAVEVTARLQGRWLLVEDLHWADGPTLAALPHLVGRVPILTTSRGPDPFDGTALRLSVPPLSRRSALAAARRLRPELDGADQERLVDLAGGNPLLLRELVTGGDPTGSPTLDEAVRSRVAALPARDRAALRLLALRGRPAPRELLGDTGTPGLGALVEEHDGSVWFTHDLLRAAVDGSIDPDDRPGLHALLAQRSDDADAAAHHLAAGNADAAAAAAERAAAGASIVERARLLLLAVTARGDGASDRLRLEAAEALVAAHRSEDAERVAATVRSDDPALRASAGWLRARASWMRGDAAGAARILDEALALVDGTRTPVEAHLRVERANVSIRDRPGDPALAEEIAVALKVAEHAGVDRARAHSLRGRSLAHSFQPGWDDHYDQAQRIARSDGDPDQECAAMYWSLSARGFFGPLADALSVGRALIRRADELGQLGWYHQALAAHGLHAASAGELEPWLPSELERLLENDPEFRNRTHVRAVLTLDRVDHGDLSGAAAMIEAGRAQARTPDEVALMCVVQAELADARGDAQLMVSTLFDLVDCGVGFFGMKVLAEGSATHLFLHAQDPPDIPRYSDLCPPIVSGIAAERKAFDAVRAGDLADGRARLEAAAARYRSQGAFRPAARALHGAARTAERSGERGAALRLLDQCRDLCRRHGFGPLLATVDRDRARIHASEVRARLTERELAVLDLVGTGATSAEIAAVLQIGRSTVDSHVDSARRKLGAATRRQAAAMLAQP